MPFEDVFLREIMNKVKVQTNTKGREIKKERERERERGGQRNWLLKEPFDFYNISVMK